MIRTPLQAAEKAFHAIKDSATDGQFAAFRKVLEKRSRPVGDAATAVRPDNGPGPKDAL